MTDVFLSHNSADKPAVEALALRLRAAGIEPWLDKWNLIPGNPWQVEIEQALTKCKTCVVFIGLSGMGPWHHEEMRALINRRVTERNGFRVIPVLLPGAKRGERSKLPTFLTATTWVEFRDTLDDDDAFHRLVAGIKGIAPGAGVGGDGFESNECPYRGLQVFEVEHAPLFFGRDALTEWLLEALRPQDGKANRFLAMLGASGSGKSSLARAGLLAQLQKGALPDSQHWVQVILRPGAKPLESLAIALCSDAQVGKGQHPADLIKQFREHETQLHWLCRQALHGQAESLRVVVLIDQFEELFTLCSDESERQAFIANLLTAATDVTGQTIVLLTLRADFYAKCAAYPQLAAALSDDQFLISPMNEAEVREAIVTPAQKVGCELEAGLVEVLLQDVKNQPGSLPLLEYTLMRLWEQRSSRVLRLADYQALGGLAGALNQRANEIYAALPAEQQSLCQRIFLRLVQPGEGTEDTRRRAQLSEFGEGEAITQLIRKLADTRLITTQQPKGSEHAFAEVAHEALIRNWSQLRGWIDADRDSLKLQHQLSQATAEWEHNQRDKAWLLTGTRLSVLQEWFKTNAPKASTLEAQFIEASIGERERTRKRNRNVLAGFITALTLFALVALWQWHGATEATSQRTESLFDSTLTHASLLTKVEDFAATATKLDNTRKLDADIPAPRRHARDLLAGYTAIMGGAAQATLQDGDKPLPSLGGVAISPDGHWLAASGERGTVALFDRVSGKLVQKLEGHNAKGWAEETMVFNIVFHPTQPWLFSGGNDGQIIRWALPHDGQPAKPFQQWSADAQGQEFGEVSALTLPPDGKVLASGHVDGKIRLWEVKETPEKKTPPGLPLSREEKDVPPKLLRMLEGHSQMIASRGLVFSPDGRQLASTSYDDTMRLWDWERGKETHRLQGRIGVAFSQDGKQLASSNYDNTILLWNAETGEQIGKPFKGHQNMVFGLQFLPDGLLASASSDNTIRLWDVETGITRHILQGHMATVIGLALWQAQGQADLVLYSASNDGTVKRWGGDLPQQWLVRLPGEPASSAISPNGEMVAVGYANGSLELYRLADQKLLSKINKAHDSAVNRLAFSPDRQLLASAGDKTAKLWNISKQPELKSRKTFKGHKDAVYAVTFSPDGSQLATASYDGRIGLFPLEGDGKPQLFGAHEGKVESVSFDSSGKHLLSAGNDDFKLKLWDLTTQPPTAKTLATANDALLWASLSPDGQQLASVGREQAVSVYPTSGTGTPLRLNGHEQSVFKAIFSPDSRQLATVSGDMTVRLWDLDTQSELFRLRLPEEATNDGPWDFDFRCTPTGCWIAVPLTSGKLALYNLGKIDY